MSELTKLLEGIIVEWKTLEEVCNVLNGFAFASKNFNNDKIGLPLIRIRDINTGFSNTYYSGNYDTKFIVENGDILIGMDGDFRVTKWHHGRALLNQRVCRLQDFKDFINPQFVYYIIRDELLRIQNKIESTTVKHLSSRELYKCLIPIPCPDNPEKSLKIQEEIVRILDSLSEETNQLTAALQKELVLHQKQYNFYREELFKFEGQEVEWKTLGEAFDLKRGRRLVKSELELEGQFAVYQNSMTPLGFYHNSNVGADTTFIICAGSAGEIGYSKDAFWAADDVYYFVAPVSMQSKYLYYLLQNHQNYILSKVRRSSVPRLSKDSFIKISVPTLNLQEQERIVKILDDLDAKTKAITKAIQKEIALRTKQYEYYRDRLLSFQSLQTDTEAIQ